MNSLKIVLFFMILGNTVTENTAIGDQPSGNYFSLRGKPQGVQCTLKFPEFYIQAIDFNMLILPTTSCLLITPYKGEQHQTLRIVCSVCGKESVKRKKMSRNLKGRGSNTDITSVGKNTF